MFYLVLLSFFMLSCIIFCVLTHFPCFLSVLSCIIFSLLFQFSYFIWSCYLLSYFVSYFSSHTLSYHIILYHIWCLTSLLILSFVTPLIILFYFYFIFFLLITIFSCFPLIIFPCDWTLALCYCSTLQATSLSCDVISFLLRFPFFSLVAFVVNSFIFHCHY